MKKWSVLLFCLLTGPGQAQEEGSAPGLAQLLKPYVHTLELQDGRVSGAGGEFLVERARDAHFLMIGEQHAAAGIADVITALYRSVAPLEYNHAAIETGPEGARRLESLLRDESDSALREYFATDHNLLSIPFYFLKEEAAFAREVVAHSNSAGPTLWGLDQEFIAGGGIVLDRLEALSGTEDEREAIGKLRELAQQNPMFLGSVPAGSFEDLEKAFADSESKEARDLVSAMVASNRIYAPFTGRGGSVYEANREREKRMKLNFMEFYWPVRQESGEVPRVFLKFGANHLFRGLSPTHVLSLGSFIMELAVAEDVRAYNLHIDCLGGEVRNPKGGGTAPCESYFLDDESRLPDAFPGSTLFVVDLEGIRSKPRILDNLDERSKELVWAFDAYVGVRNPEAATLFEGDLPDF